MKKAINCLVFGLLFFNHHASAQDDFEKLVNKWYEAGDFNLANLTQDEPALSRAFDDAKQFVLSFQKFIVAGGTSSSSALPDADHQKSAVSVFAESQLLSIMGSCILLSKNLQSTPSSLTFVESIFSSLPVPDEFPPELTFKNFSYSRLHYAGNYSIIIAHQINIESAVGDHDKVLHYAGKLDQSKTVEIGKNNMLIIYYDVCLSAIHKSDVSNITKYAMAYYTLCKEDAKRTNLTFDIRAVILDSVFRNYHYPTGKNIYATIGDSSLLLYTAACVFHNMYDASYYAYQCANNIIPYFREHHLKKELRNMQAVKIIRGETVFRNTKDNAMAMDLIREYEQLNHTYYQEDQSIGICYKYLGDDDKWQEFLRKAAPKIKVKADDFSFY